ncbi:MAG: hypothetical protein K0S39_6224 [Paenibacillus sp.]|nr:hypothetical protein [Paenibacillus sp.]
MFQKNIADRAVLTLPPRVETLEGRHLSIFAGEHIKRSHNGTQRSVMTPFYR